MLAAQSGRRGGALQVGAPRGGYEVCARERQPAPVVEPGLSFNMKVLRAKDRLDVPKLQSFHLISSHFCAFLCAESHRSLHARAGLVLGEHRALLRSRGGPPWCQCDTDLLLVDPFGMLHEAGP